MTTTDTQRDQDEAAFESARESYYADMARFVDALEELGHVQQQIEADGHAAATLRMTPSLLRTGRNGLPEGVSTARPFVPERFGFDLTREATELRKHLPSSI